MAVWREIAYQFGDISQDRGEGKGASEGEGKVEGGVEYDTSVKNGRGAAFSGGEMLFSERCYVTW